MAKGSRPNCNLPLAEWHDRYLKYIIRNYLQFKLQLFAIARSSVVFLGMPRVQRIEMSSILRGLLTN